MKKNLLSLLCACSFYYSYAQYEFGVEGSIASCWFTNNNVSNAGSSQKLGMAPSYNYGLDVAIDFTQNFAVVGNLLWGNYTQAYNGSFSKSGVLTDGAIYLPNQTYTATTTLKTMDIPVLLRIQTNSGSFVEFGAQYSIINDASYSATYSSPVENVNENVKGAFASSNVQGIFGFGNNFMLNESWFIIAEFRVLYGFTDIKGVDGLGQDLNNNNLYSGPTPYYSSYQATHTITGSFNLGIYYYLETNFMHHQGHQKCRGPARARG